MEGSRGFNVVPPRMEIPVVTGSDKNGLYYDISTTFTNPGDVTFSIGKVHLKLIYKDTPIGLVRIDEFVASPGQMAFTAQLPDQTAGIQRL